MSHYPAYTNGRLDPQADALLTRLALEPSTPTSTLTPGEARASFLLPSWLGTPREMAVVGDLAIPGPAGPIPLRTYVRPGRLPLPVLVFFHGGGFVLGTLDEFDAFCTFLADGAECLVVSVGYRLSPEQKFPAATQDAVAALSWVGAHADQIGGDPTRIGVAGDSAGGNLAAVAALAARDQGGPALVQQVLISPWVDLSCTETES
ncbi:MAG: alpha/beta hydrolase fold domain-containing protein, partial [Deltaproteobacteria bacterium]|nr:alpha/beta hydrolase fold domain-containing protein [Deltaproteobacteria bacterium]